MRLESASFREGEPIPKEHSRDGADSHPALAWSGAPRGTRSFALICDDPDAPRGRWVHWILYDVPASAAALPAGISKAERHAAGGTHGRNDFDELGWGGPAPPRGHGVHHYEFRLYALDAELGLPPGLNRRELEAAMKGHLLDETTLTGTYVRD
ncbi:MAG: YbhB/YbcL family Raf kinase inhibitor-like protein [Thermoanaerobaculia bacterium]